MPFPGARHDEVEERSRPGNENEPRQSFKTGKQSQPRRRRVRRTERRIERSGVVPDLEMAVVAPSKSIPGNAVERCHDPESDGENGDFNAVSEHADDDEPEVGVLSDR